MTILCFYTALCTTVATYINMFKFVVFLTCLAIKLSAVQAAYNPKGPSNAEMHNYECSWKGTAPVCGYYCLGYDDFVTSNYGFRYNQYYCDGIVAQTDDTATPQDHNSVGFGKPCLNNGCKIRCCRRR